ncbi:MAG: type I restriction endonuclease [Mariprofundaceae bacterium]|nr:type I restriction endonuclease [Mariprofundaceae bacterium]
MSDLTEDDVEQNLIDLLQEQGYTYFNDSTINPTSDNPQRDAFDSVVLEKQFHASLRKLNPDLPEPALHEAFQHVLHLGTNDIMTNNEKFHQMLSPGQQLVVRVSVDNWVFLSGSGDIDCRL